MARLSKRKIYIKKLEERVIKLKKLYIASLGDDDVLQIYSGYGQVANSGLLV